MFTQCPECGVAFRVTAEVLKQAAGKVRCGGCGTAFNALEHLSEEKPHVPERRRSQPRLPELTPDEPPELEPDETPKTISAEQSAALLKTLDELAGEDIRIEDTGVEWRVVSDEDDADTDADDDVPAVRDLRDDSELIADTGSLKFVLTDDDQGEAEIDEVLDDSPTPVDQFVTDAPPQVDAPEVFEEMRFDDNTPLPEDFDLDAPSPPPEPVADAPEPVAEVQDPQVDLELGDPDDWEDLLEEVSEPVAEATADAVPDVEPETGDDADIAAEEPAAAELEGAAEPPDVDTQFAIQAEAMGIDLTGMHKQADEEAIAVGPDETEIAGLDDVDRSETTIEEDLIAAAFETEAAARQRAEPETESADTGSDAEPLELALTLEPEDEAAASSFAGEPEPDEAGDVEGIEEEPELAASAEELEEELRLAADEGELAAELELTADDDELEEEPELAASDEQLEAAEYDIGAESPIELDETAIDDAELLDEFREKPVDERSLEIRLDGINDVLDSDSGEHAVPELSEEEKTINMLIDQDLLSIAVEDEDGFASTIVQRQPDEKVEAEIEAGKPEEDEPVELEAEAEYEVETDTEAETDADIELKTGAAIAALKGKVPLVETIIMEGESIRAEEDEERSAKNRRLGAELKARQAEQDLLKAHSSGASKYGMIAAAVLLALLLVLQIVHQSREALATIPAFNDAVGPVYRMLGTPLTPAWDIKGWRFEATKGSTDEADEVLTIYSRIGNQSDGALPYPLVHVSLTDRFEDIIGSRVLEPGEYLGSDADPRELVPPGNTFNAVISIESPTAEATGFKLNVCYRLTGGQLRCAIEDFK